MYKLVKCVKNIFFVVAILVFLSSSHSVMAADSADDIIYESVMQSDGKIVIGGSFSLYNFVGRNRIARINSDGTLDTSFDPGAGVNDGGYIGVEAVALQSDEKIIIAGDFSAYDGVSRKNIARINSDGTLDTSFDSGGGSNDTIRTVAVQGDGKILVGGDFTTYSGAAWPHIVRLNADGSVDSSFDPGSGFVAMSNVFDIAVQSDGRIIVAGEFVSYDGVARNNIVRINVDGSVDMSFSPISGANLQVSTISIQPDGKILIGGGFTTYDGVSRSRIARLNSNGTLDTSFNPGTGTNYYVISIAIQSDGKILIGGNFTLYNGVFPINGIVRLNADGSRDTSFNTGSGADDFVHSIIVQSDGSIFLSGEFRSFNGFNMGHVAHLSSIGVLDMGFGLPDPPSVTTNIVTNIDGSSATGNGVVVDTGGEPVDRFMEWGTSSGNYTGSCGAGQGDVGSYSCNMYGLASNTMYYVRAGAQNSGGTSYGEEVTFVSGSSPLITQDPTDITANSAWGNAMLDITCDGEGDPAECSMIFDQYIEWGTSSGEYWEGSCYAGSGNVGVFGCGIDYLEPNTTYYVRATMDSGGETPVVFYGNEVSFTTTDSGGEEGSGGVTTNPVTSIIDTEAIGNATIFFDCSGGEPPSACSATFDRYIQWGTETGNYEESCNAGTDYAGSYSCELTGLTPSTTYYVQAFIDEIGGEGEVVNTYMGNEITFTTTSSGGGSGTGDSMTTPQNLNLTISENLTLNCGSSIDLDNGTTLTAGTPQTNTTTCQVTTNDQEGYNLSLTDDRTTNNALYHTTNNSTQDGQIQDKASWNNSTPNAQTWTGTGLGFGILSSTATKNTAWWGNANNCNDTTQLYAGLPDTDTNIMEHTTYSNTHTDTTICYKLDIPSTQLSGEYTGSVTYTAAGRP